MKTELDWSAYDSYGAGDAYAAIPSEGGAFGKAAAVCIGNRQCQRTEKGVMCPSYRVTGDVRHSTWHRASTLKAALNGELGNRPFIGPELDEAMDLCVGCKGCKRECPNGVDMAQLRVETLAQRWGQSGGAPLRVRLLANLPRFAPWLPHLHGLLDLRERWPALARWGARWFGIAAQRSLPRASHRSFLETYAGTPGAEPRPREVVLLVDTFSNHFEPETAAAAVAVLQAAGFGVIVAGPSDEAERPLCCGRTYLSHGLVDQARREAQRVVSALAPYAQRGLPIIGLEPSCLLMLRDEYYSLGLGEEAVAVAKCALLLEEFLAKEKGLKLELGPLDVPKVLVHGHCHQKAFGAMKAMRKVLGWIPQLEVELVESSCCGMAGSFGLEAEHYEVSMQMGELDLLPKVREAGPDTLVIANGTSCRHQIRDGAAREGVHLAQVLKAALRPSGGVRGFAEASAAMPPAEVSEVEAG